MTKVLVWGFHLVQAEKLTRFFSVYTRCSCYLSPSPTWLDGCVKSNSVELSFSSFSSWTLFNQETKKQLNVQHLMQLPLSLVYQKQQQAQKKKVRLLQEKAKQNNNKKNAYTRKCCARIQISWTVCLAHVCIFRSDPRHGFSSFFGVHNKKVSFLMIVNYDFQFLCQLLLVGTGRATCFFFPWQSKSQ